MRLFRFRSPSASAKPPDPLQSPQSAAAWYAGLPRADAIGRQQTAVAAIAAACTPPAPITPDRMAAVEYLDVELAVDRGRLITQYVEHATASPAVANRIWQAAYDISQGFIVAYRALLEHALGHPGDRHWQEATPRLIGRLVHFHGTDAKLRVLKSESWIPAKWMELHRLYRRAVDLGVARVPFAPPGAAGAARSTVEQEYIAVLLSHQLNTGTLAAADIDWAAGEVRIWSAGLRLEAAPQAGRGFCVDLDGRSGLVRSEQAGGGAVCHLDTTPLTAQLDRALAALHERFDAGTTAERTLTGRRYAILEKLRPALCPEAPPALPRDPRVKVSLLAQVRVGLPEICRELAPSEARNLAVDAPEAAAGDAADLDGVLVGAPPAERLWQIENRSDTGLRILGPIGLGQGLVLGGLVAVRAPREHDWVLGIVRRVTRPMTERIEIGVSILSPRVLAVAVHAKRQSRDDLGIVVDGVDASTIGERFDALYLPPPPQPNREHPPAGRSLVIPTSEHAPGRHVVLLTVHTVYTIALATVLERQQDWTWVAFDVVDRTQRS